MMLEHIEKEHIENVIRKVMATNDYSLINKELSLDERIKFIEYLSSVVADKVLSDETLSDDIMTFMGNLPKDDEKKIRRNFFSQEESLELTKNMEQYNPDVKYIIYCSLPTDTEKEKYLNTLSDEIDYSALISDFDSDELKIKYLDKFGDNIYSISKILIVESLDSLELKISCLDKLDYDEKLEVVKKLDSQESKISCLDMFDDLGKFEIVEGLDSPELKISCLDKLSYYRKFDIVKNLDSSELKISCLDMFDGPEKFKIVESFDSPELKISCLEKLSKTQKVNIIANLGKGTDELKISYLDMFDGPEKSVIISSLDNLELIRGFLDKFDSSTKILVVSALNSFELKIGCLDKLTDKEKAQVIAGLGKGMNKLKIDCLDKFCAIFNSDNFKMDKGAIDSTLESILLKEFMYEKSDIWQTFSSLKGMCERGEVSSVRAKLIDIINYTKGSKNLAGGDLKNFILDYDRDNSMLDDFISQLIKSDNPLVLENTMNKLKSITGPYINLNIEDYKNLRKKEIYADDSLLRIDRKIDRNFLIKNVIENNNFDTLKNFIGRYYTDRLTPDILEALKWRKENPSNAPKEIKRYFKEINNIFVSLYDNHYVELSNLLNALHGDILYDNKYFMIDNTELVDSVLRGCDLSGICELCSDSDEKRYNMLLELINKYHVFGLGNNFERLLVNNDIDYNIDYIINNIKSIVNSFRNKNIDNMGFIDALNLIFAGDQRLKIILGEDNQELINTNPGPNSSPMKTDERKALTNEYIRLMYNHRKTNIPPIDKQYVLNDNKKINVNVGNFTDPINLTYGERTGACMRIGGAGRGLFNFCLENAAGVHVRFTSDEGNFISRVSGFRTGNTLFLNELRCSVLPDDYTDADILSTCKMVAQDIIDKTHDSEYPIENVVATNQYVLSNAVDLISLDVDLPKNGKKAPEYYDVDPNNCVLLATSNKDESRRFVPFKDTAMPEYDVLREPVKYIRDFEEINTAIERIEMINEILSGKNIADIDDVDKKGEYISAYVGEDFYVAIDKLGNVDKYIMPNTKDKERAIVEMKHALNKLGQAVNKISNDMMMDYSEPVLKGHTRGHVMFVMLLVISSLISFVTISLVLLKK